MQNCNIEEEQEIFISHRVTIQTVARNPITQDLSLVHKRDKTISKMNLNQKVDISPKTSYIESHWRKCTDVIKTIALEDLGLLKKRRSREWCDQNIIENPQPKKKPIKRSTKGISETAKRDTKQNRGMLPKCIDRKSKIYWETETRKRNFINMSIIRNIIRSQRQASGHKEAANLIGLNTS